MQPLITNNQFNTSKISYFYKTSGVTTLTRQKMTVEAPTRPRYNLADLMAEMPDGLPRAEG